MKLDVAEQVTADAALGSDLYRALAGPGSLVLSPASIAGALRMALLGARGETAAELARVLHLPGPDAARAGAAQDVLPQDVLAQDLLTGSGITLRVVNTAWLDAQLAVRQEFLSQPVTVARARFRQDPDGARQAINAAVAEQTAGKVAGLIGPGVLDAVTRLVLVNAVYLKARWLHQFSPRATKPESFYPERSGPVPVPMMHQVERLAYHRADGYQAVLLPYAGAPLAMAVVLPDEPLSAFPLQRLGGVAGVLQPLLAGRDQYQVDLRLPRFTVTSGFLLRDTLQSLGVSAAFGEDADFSAITDSEPLSLSEAIHRAYIEVDEQGTEAAAATAVAVAGMAMVRPARKVAFTADRPFLFAVVATDTGLPLFLGQVTRP